MNQADIISAYETEFGVTIHHIVEVKEDESVLQIRTYTPEDEDFIWALEQARKLNDD